jgi:hypothetical protein
MPLKRMQVSTWEKLTADGIPEDLRGLSPGGAASELGITRQGVHDAIRRGALDAYAVYRGSRLAFFIVRQPSLDAYKKRITERLQDRVKYLTGDRRAG